MADSYDLVYTEYFRAFTLCKNLGFNNVEADALANQRINHPDFLATLSDPTLSAPDAPTSIIDRLFSIEQNETVSLLSKQKVN